MATGASSDEKRDEEAFNALLGKMMNTPAKPHDQMKKGRGPRPAPDPTMDSEGAPTNCSAQPRPLRS